MGWIVSPPPPKFLCWSPNPQGFRMSLFMDKVSEEVIKLSSLGIKSGEFVFTHAWLSARIPSPWNFSGKNTRVGCHFFFQGIFPTQGLNSCLLHLLHWQVDSLPLNHPGRALSLLINDKMVYASSIIWKNCDEYLKKYEQFTVLAVIRWPLSDLM